ncbi:hypothetical protein MUK42_36873 [Musa troglodytarum]|uniref:Uncharacterized protein n=1 Tax=Musa troglodytarum TaxID=320322 RepID=A0A9E7K0U9_9LILI|nr:hypothetical protein MUK42_36873 [Musa troglodytarum]
MGPDTRSNRLSAAWKPEIGGEAQWLDGARRRIDGRARVDEMGEKGTHRHKVTGRMWLDVGASMPRRVPAGDGPPSLLHPHRLLPLYLSVNWAAVVNE